MYMKTAGIDVGFDTIKVVIADDGKIVAKAIGEAGCMDRAANIEKLYNEALSSAGLKTADVDKVAATGIGKFSVGFADDRISDAVAQAKAARHFHEGAASVVDVGADKTHVVILENGGISEVVLNQKCMAGLGLMLDVMANRLGYTLEEVSGMEAIAGNGVAVNDGCPVFAELDSLEALNRGVPKEEVMNAVIDAAVYRINSILHDKIRPDSENTVLLGGVSANAALVSRLKERSGISFIVPEDAVYGGAIGCALAAV